MKYRLKRDLPFAKAGTVIDYVYHRRGTSTLSYIKIGDCRCELDADKINIFDWIEEIKPREFWVNLYDIGEGGIFKTKEAANTVASSGRTEIIKVREVIDEQKD